MHTKMPSMSRNASQVSCDMTGVIEMSPAEPKGPDATQAPEKKLEPGDDVLPLGSPKTQAVYTSGQARRPSTCPRPGSTFC